MAKRRFHGSAASIMARDLLFGALFVIVAMLFFVLPYINPKADQVPIPEKKDMMFIELVWQDDNHVDLDLVVKGPNDEVVFFRHSNGEIFSLVRDDRGKLFDDTGFNFETMVARSVPDGEYQINVFLYSLAEGELPVQAKVIVTITGTQEKIAEDVDVFDVQVEKTVVRFIISDGKIVGRSYFHEDIIPEIVLEELEMEEM